MNGGTAPRDFALLLPPDWVRISLDSRERERVVGLVNERVQQLPPQRREPMRLLMTRELLEALRRAESAGAIDVFLSLGERHGRPVAASCLISYLDSGRAPALDGLMSSFSEEGDEVSLVNVADAPAVRRRTIRKGEVDGLAVTSTEIDFFVPLPGSTGLLVLAFGTAIEPLAEAFVGLFDAMADSLRWVD